MIADKIHELFYNWNYNIESHPYHTAYVVRYIEGDLRRSGIEFLASTQLEDGSWGSAIKYRADQLLSTLAVINTGLILDLQIDIASGINWLKQNIGDILVEKNQLVGFYLTLGHEMNVFSKLTGFSSQKITIFLKKFETLIKQIEMIDISKSYYLWSLEAFDVEYVRQLSGSELIQSDGSVFGVTSATAFFYEVANINDRKKIIQFLSNIQNKDGGFGNFKADYVAIMFSTLPFLISGQLDVIKDYLMPIMEKILNDIHEDGISLGSSFPVGDLDDTVTAFIIADALNLGEFDINNFLHKYKQQGYRTYLVKDESVGTTRIDKEIVETEILAKTGIVYSILNNVNEKNTIQELLIREIEKSNQSRWYLFPEYQLPQILLFLLYDYSKELSDLLLTYSLKYLENICNNQYLVDDMVRIAFVIITIEIGKERLGWKIGNHEIDLNDLEQWLLATELPQTFKHLWVSKVLYSIPLMDQMWVLTAKLLIREKFQLTLSS